MTVIERSFEVYDQNAQWLPVESVEAKPGGTYVITVEVEGSPSTTDRGAVRDAANLRATIRNILDAGFHYAEEYRDSLEDALDPPTSGGQ